MNAAVRHTFLAVLVGLAMVLPPSGGWAADAGQPAPPGSQGHWTTTGAMGQSREGGGAGNGRLTTLLPDGRVLAAGGFTTEPTADVFTFVVTDNYLAESEIYNPSTGTWQQTGQMKHGRFGPALATLHTGKVLAAGGYSGGFAVTGSGYRRSAELYDPETGEWTATEDMKTCRGSPTTSTLDSGKVLVAGGIGCDASSQASAEIYNPDTQSWESAASMHDARTAHSATTLPDGRVLVAGGRDTTGVTDEILNSAEIYDPATDTWTETHPMNVARSFHAADWLSSTDQVLVAGGRCPGQMIVGPPLPTDCKTASAELFDPATGTWASTADMSTARIFAGSVVLPAERGRSEKFLIAGGAQQGTAELYDPANRTWTPTGAMNDIHDDAPLLRLPDGTVLIAGGFEMDRPNYRTTDTAELYHPPGPAGGPPGR
jgi:hypothetical protein